MQFSNNKTKRTRKSAEESATAPLEGVAARVEENAKPRQKRTTEKATESAAAITNHRKATKKADQTIPQTAPAIEPVVARQSAAAPSIAHRQGESRIVTHGDIASLAYSYWENRGYQGGCSVEDWLRAERELRLS